MNARTWSLAAALCLVVPAVGCKSEESGHTPTPTGPTLTLNASTTTVVANGTNTVTLTVTDTGGVAVTVTTDRGTFSTGGQSVVVPAGSGATTGTLTLVTCDSGANVGCAGAATVTATSTTGQATRAINFTSLASACGTNCGADTGCVGRACTLTGGGTGTCSASSPSVCSSGTAPNPNARLGGFAIPPTFATHPVMGVKSSGWNEFGGVSVQVLDDQGQSWPDGLVVRFEHRQLGGSTFGAPLATTTLGACTAAAHCVAYDATTVDGVASVPLFSGTVAGTLVVTASTSVGTETRSVTLPGIAVVGAKASGTNLAIQCGPRNVPALAETDCSTSWVEAQITCAALLKDRFNNLLGTSTQVIFASEAAAVGQVAWTPAYDPESQGEGQPDLGAATQVFQTLGAGLPFDVTPQTGEQSVSHGYDGCGTRTHNPRDGVVTVVAIADGEEGFFDANANGAYDAPVGTTSGEPFVDQGEPFIDQNDSGGWDPGEWFVDVDHSGAYTGPNGTWDAQAKIWTQTIVVYAAAPATMVKSATAPATYLGTRWIDDGTAWTDACTATTAAALFDVASDIAGPPPIPGTAATYFVVASDMNLNRLDTATAYDVKPFGDAKVKVTYRGLPKYADEFGMSYRYWPCDQAATPSCASHCRAAVGGTGGTGPCLMKPQVSGFECGLGPVPVIIGGGTEADVGLVEIDWLVDTPWENFVEGRIAKHLEPVFGYSDNDPLTP
ncbi:MAG TPA: hypothetical protein VFL83_20270 [Anaeromyxobacter sp.]|nr:hypothetical protein [Anaeromyxobacter sp.]